MSATETAAVPDPQWNAARGRPQGAKSDERARVRLPTGTSLAIRGVIGLIRQVAEHDSTVLVLGESGTGKEVVARAVHDLSPRRQRPFVAVNCGAIPAELLESELFGHEKGAFTGAVAARKGRFEIAEGGTLFLDEIGDMSPTMQVKLLRVLQERVFERVGNHVPIRCNVRIIAATHRNLEEAIESAAFRADLYHRLNVFPIEMPPLRQRIEDLPLLVRDFIAFNIAEGRGRVELSPRALAALALHRWPGNVRELANIIERLSIVSSGRIADVSSLPAKYRPSDWTPDPETESEDAMRMGSFDAQRTGDFDALRAGGFDAAAHAGDFATAPAFLGEIESAVHEPMREAEYGLEHGHRYAKGPGRVEQDPEDPEPERRTVAGMTAGTADAAAGAAGGPAVAAVSDLARLPQSGLDLREHLAAIERRLIEQALERTGGTVAHAARLLNLRRTTLVEKLRKLGITEAVTED